MVNPKNSEGRKLTNKILFCGKHCLIAMLGLLLLGGAEAEAGGGAPTVPIRHETELGKLAASMQPGEWQELETAGYSRQLVTASYQGEMAEYNHGRDSIFNYTNSAAWDPKAKKLFFVGLGHYAALKFISYSAETNEWTLMPVPHWADPRKPEKSHWPRGHAYSNNALDVANRWFLFGFQRRQIYRYDLEKSKWIEPIALQKGMPTYKDANAGIRSFPELGGIIRFWRGRLDLYSPDANLWKSLGDHPGIGMHGLAAYSAKQKVMVFGGGSVKDGPPVLYRLDAEGKVTRLKEPPLPILQVQSTIFTADPVTGEILAGAYRGKAPRTMYALDAMKDEWRKLPVTLPEGKFIIAAAVPNYGVTMFCTDRPAKVWIYKHEPHQESEG
jgi:hypothetical protein